MVRSPRTRSANPLDRHRQQHDGGIIRIAVLLFALVVGSACAPYPRSRVTVTAPLSPDELRRVRSEVEGELAGLVLRDGASFRGPIARVSSTEVATGPYGSAKRLQDVASITVPMSTRDRVWRGAFSGAFLVGTPLLVAAASPLEWAWAEDNFETGFLVGAGLGVLYGALVPQDRTFVFGSVGSAELLPEDDGGGGVVLLRFTH